MGWAGLDLSFAWSQGECNCMWRSRLQPIGSRKQLEPRSRSAVHGGENFVSELLMSRHIMALTLYI